MRKLTYRDVGSNIEMGDMASAGARAYKGSLGAEPPAGSRGRAPDQGVRTWSWRRFSSEASTGRPKSPHMCAACCQLPAELCYCL